MLASGKSFLTDLDCLLMAPLQAADKSGYARASLADTPETAACTAEERVRAALLQKNGACNVKKCINACKRGFGVLPLQPLGDSCATRDRKGAHERPTGRDRNAECVYNIY